MSTAALLKRLESLRQTIRFSRPRWIFVMIDGHAKDQSAADAIVEALEPTADDTVLFVAKYTDPDLPRLGGISHF